MGLKNRARALVTVVGHKRAGKNTIGDLFQQSVPSVKQVALADAMKEFACKLLGMNLETLERLKELEDVSLTPFGTEKHSSMRTFLQVLGQEVKALTGDDLIWCRILAKKLDLDNEEYVITDVRFPFEEAFFRKLADLADIDYVSIKVERDGCGGDSHESEKYIDDIQTDIVIENNGTIEELDYSLKKAIHDIVEESLGNDR